MGDVDEQLGRAAPAIRRRSPVGRRLEGPVIHSRPFRNQHVQSPRSVTKIVLSEGSSGGGGRAPRGLGERTLEAGAGHNTTAETAHCWRRNTQAARAESRAPSGTCNSQTNVVYHFGSAVSRARMKSAPSNVRGFWQSSVAEEQKSKREETRSTSSKPYSFPRWRSSDALSASLVASNSVDVPKDSRIPEQRLKKMRETDRLAQIHKAHIHKQVEPPRSLRKGKSLDSLIIHVDYQPWYDRDKIRESVCRESIGNIAEAKERFEPRSEVGRPTEGYRHQHGSSGQAASSHDDPAARLDTSQQNLPSDDSQTYPNVYYGAANGTRTTIHSNGIAMSEKQRESSLEQVYSSEEQLLMLFLKQHPEIASSLGITCSYSTMRAMESLPRIAVELRLSDETHLTSATSPRQGRYLKKCQTAPSSHLHAKALRNDSYETNGPVQPPNEKRIGSLVQSEIKQLRRREEELYESRAQLGLPTLEETVDRWKRGPQANFRCTSSCDQINHRATPLQPLFTDELRDY